MSQMATDNVLLVIITIRLFPHSIHITGFVTGVTRLAPLVEKELLISPVHLRSFAVFVGFVLLNILLSVYCRPLFFSCCHFRLALVMSVLRFTGSAYPREYLSFFKNFNHHEHFLG